MAENMHFNILGIPAINATSKNYFLSIINY